MVDNVYFVMCNVMVFIGEWIKSYYETSGATVDLVIILYLDLYFKMKYKKC